MPYEPDDRIQDFLEAICLNKLNRSAEARQAQKRIVDYSLGHYTDASFNNLLALTILEESGETEKAGDLLNKISTFGECIQSCSPVGNQLL